ncbi:MAG: ATP-binding protein [Anaerolineales bacterium]|jgi:two-component system OmpR family sensor kinase/two-component system sensor histidine kinase BaeS
MPPHNWREHRHHYRPSWGQNRRFIFWRFAMIFGGMSLFFLTAIGIVLYLVFGQTHPENFPVGLVVTAICGVPLFFMLMASLLGGLAFRRLGTPFADIMSATDAIAKGDLSVRLSESDRRRGPLDNLARRFNNMVAELERAEQQRRNMTADIAHELRTPLHIIQGNLEGMLDGVYEPTEENITDTLEETRLLARLVEDLQTLSLAEAGQLPLHPTRFLLADLLTDAATGFESRAAAQNVTLRVDIPNPSLEIEADYDRLIQVLANLLTNALRHTPEKGRISLQGESISEGIRITVSDTGAGIPAEDLPYIFDRFWRGDKSRARTEGSSGLGLAITKQLVLAHGGVITAKSEVGDGAIFMIELPV